MSLLTNWLWGASQLDDAIDKATSELLPAGGEDIALSLEICDQIRSKSVPAKDAARALKRRLNHKNPNVQILALGLTDICVKNGGDLFLAEVASRDFMDNLASIIRVPGLNSQVKESSLKHVQDWAIAFEGKPLLAYVDQIYKALKSEGFTFPPRDLALANAAMVDTKTAPEWIDSEVCLRCRTAFSFTNRKHHCRNCGQVFDQQCSAKSMPLPHYGITQDVRVCDGCAAKLKKNKSGDSKGHRSTASVSSGRHRTARELSDAELQRAIQLSLEEVGSASGHKRPGYVPSAAPAWQASEPPLVDRSSASEAEDDPDLQAAIQASLREANAPRASAPFAMDTPRAEESPAPWGPGYSQSYPPSMAAPAASALPNYDLEPLESDAILTFSQTVEQVQQSQVDMGRYPAVGELYDKASSLRPKLGMSMDDTGRKEQVLSEMHDKLSQAVKLYDQILTDQVSQRQHQQQLQWQQQQQQAAHSGYYQQQPQYSGGQYGHPRPEYAPPMQQQEYVPQQRTGSQEYAPQQRQQEYIPPAPPQFSQSMYQPQQPQFASMVSAPHLVPHSPPSPPSRQNTTPLAPPIQQFQPLPPPPQQQQQPPPQQQQHYQHQQQQQYTPTPSLPNFPVAPTLSPTNYSLSSPTTFAPPQQQQPERKEVLLIDL